MGTDDGNVNLVGKAKSGIEAKVGVFGLQVFVDEELQDHARYLNAVERHGLNFHVAHATRTAGIGDHFNVMNAAEDAEERVGGVAALLEAIEIHVRITGDHARCAVQDNGLHAGGELHASCGEVSVHLRLGEDGGALVGVREQAVLLDMLELAIHAVSKVLIAGKRASMSEESGGQEKDCETHGRIVYEHGAGRRVSRSGFQRGFSGSGDGGDARVGEGAGHGELMQVIADQLEREINLDGQSGGSRQGRLARLRQA